MLDDVEPWFSDKDIGAGERWSQEIGQWLQRTNFGIICLTGDNLESPWILFEAGALSKVLEEGLVCPYLLDVEVKDISGPLSQFQAKRTDEKSTLELLQSINTVSRQIPETRLVQRFNSLWPSFEQTLQEILEEQEESQEPSRPEPEILEELVNTVRAVDRRLGNLDMMLEVFKTLTLERTQEAGTAISIPSQWSRMIQYMKDNRKAPAAAVYEEARIKAFNDNLLELVFPKELAIYTKLASDERHVAALQDAMESVYGVRPKEVRCEVSEFF